MMNLAVALHTILTNAYTLFCLLLGGWAVIIAARSQTVSGNFVGAMFTCTFLAVAILVLSLLMQLGGLPPERGFLYYLYLIYFVIAMPGTYALLRGRDDRTAAWIYAGVILFTFLTSLSRSDLLTNYLHNCQANGLCT